MIDVEKVVRAQIALFRAYESAERRSRPGRGREGMLSYGPYLLISREKGAGGSTIGEKVGARMGWPVFDHQLIDAIAERAQVRRELIESLDEHDRLSIHAAVEQLMRSEQFDAAGYQSFLRETVLALGDQGDVVIVGRGAEFILPGAFGLRLRVVAPAEVRSQRIAAEQHLSAAQARTEVEKSDRERAKRIHRHFGKELRDPSNYDLTLNSAGLTIDAATEIVVAALQAKLGVRPRKPVAGVGAGA